MLKLSNLIGIAKGHSFNVPGSAQKQPRNLLWPLYSSKRLPMKKSILIFMAMGLVCSLTSGQTTEQPDSLLPKQWVHFESEVGGFKVWTPASLHEKVDSITTPIGILAYHTFFLAQDIKQADNALYMVSFCDYPAGGAHSDSTELLADFFNETMEAAASSVDGDLLYQDDITYNNEFPGKFWRINYLNDQAVIKTKALLVKNRFYTIQTIMLRERSLNPDSERFLDSFQLTDPKHSANH